MSASDPNSAIFMSDTVNDIKKKINKHAFSGGQVNIEEHRKLGGNPDVDVSYQYLTYFLEDDTKLADLREKYESGELLTGELKKECIALMQQYVAGFQERRSKVNDQTVAEYMKPRRLEWGGNPTPNPDAGKKDGSRTDHLAARKEDGFTSDHLGVQTDGTLEKSVTVDGSMGASLKPPKRPGLGEKKNTYNYSVRGLSSYGDSVTEMLYPTKSNRT